jgi:hypothetical protein
LAINIATTIWYLITNYEIYEAERGVITKNLRKKGETMRYYVDKCMKIIG